MYVTFEYPLIVAPDYRTTGLPTSGIAGRLLPEAILSRILTAYIEPDHPSYSFDAMHDRLYAKGFTIYPGKGAQQDTFRLANMGAVHPADMRAFVSAMKKTLDEMGVSSLYRSAASER